MVQNGKSHLNMPTSSELLYLCDYTVLLRPSGTQILLRKKRKKQQFPDEYGKSPGWSREGILLRE